MSRAFQALIGIWRFAWCVPAAIAFLLFTLFIWVAFGDEADEILDRF